ncbi:MAG: hypothetical protein ACI8W7_003255 [Gammaproteobacteria bacterium]|jgi:hypothetical protein
MFLTFEKGLDGIYRVLRFLTDKILGYGAAVVMLGATLACADGDISPLRS